MGGGKYHFNQTLALTKQHSNMLWTAAQGEHVVLSGGKKLELEWTTYNFRSNPVCQSGPRAARWSPLVLSAQEQQYHTAHSSPSDAHERHDFGPPRAQWNTLFANGERQVRVLWHIFLFY